ncbi:MAG TPA: PAS domain S-box protein, partial [Anaerolineae bacterium]|nr:PAS domain S-box protein [Anaerolineae bacterium]
TLVSGASVAIRDIATDPHTAAAAARFAALQLGAVVCVPYISAGRLKSLLVIGHRAAYDWRSDEIELTRALTARLWPAIERAQTEEKLREAEQRFRATFEQAPVGIAHVTPDGRWLLVNRRLCEITGYSAAELLSRTFQDLTHPADLATDLDFMHRVLAGKMAGYAMEKRYYRQDGSLVWVNLTVSLVRDAAGEPKYFITVIEDITERKQGEEKLRESEERFRSVFESIDEGFCIVEMIFDEANRPVDYRFLQINPVFAQLTGLEDAIGKTARELVPELEEFWFETYGRVALTGEAIRFENGSVPMGRWFDVHASRVGGADSRRVAIIFNNITARKRAEEGQQLLAETSRLLPTSLHVTDRLETVGQLFVKEFADWCMLHLLAADGSLPLAIAEHREPEKTALIYELGQAYPLVAPAAEDTAPVMGPKQARLYESFPASLLAGHSQDPLFFRPSLELLGAGSTLLAPLVVREQTLGFITLVRAGSRPTFDHTDLTLIEEVAYRTAIALDNAYLYEAERAARLEAEAAQKSLALLAETRERNRLAQELHDTVAQALGYLNLKIAMTQSLLASNQPEAVKANLQELKQVIGETYTDVREEIFYLRSKALSDLGFMELLERYIDKYRRFYKLEVELVQEADPALFEFQPETTSQLIRTIQEALINIRKHARVNTATIRLAEDKGAIRISIEDEGQGFDLVQSQGQNSSFGLLIMRERVESVGGSLKIETSPGQGTRVIVYRFAP